MQTQADLLGRPVLRGAGGEVAAIGAALLAGLALGTFSSVDALVALPRPRSVFEPRIHDDERSARVAAWRKAVARAKEQRS
jgi:glycerol kinase